MNKRRTIDSVGERNCKGIPLFGRLFTLSRRSVPSALLLLVFALLSCARVEGYVKMENDRVLLMNNDSKFAAAITSQGYYDTNVTAKTYWVHSGATVAPLMRASLRDGSIHKMYRSSDGALLWELQECRAGSGTAVGNNNRNYIPWENSSKPLDTTKPMSATQVGSVVFRNTAEARLYSPYYGEGIGTIYFDAVNAYVDDVSSVIALEVATNALNGANFETAENSEENFDWKPCPFDVMTVETSNTLSVVESGVTTLTLASAAG